MWVPGWGNCRSVRNLTLLRVSLAGGACELELGFATESFLGRDRGSNFREPGGFSDGRQRISDLLSLG